MRGKPQGDEIVSQDVMLYCQVFHDSNTKNQDIFQNFPGKHGNLSLASKANICFPVYNFLIELNLSSEVVQMLVMIWKKDVLFRFYLFKKFVYIFCSCVMFISSETFKHLIILSHGQLFFFIIKQFKYTEIPIYLSCRFNLLSFCYMREIF